MEIAELLRILGSRIRALREARGWSQEELARRSGRHYTYIGRIERGEQNVTIEVLLEIVRALDTRVSELLDEPQHRLLKDWGVTAMDIVEAVGQGFRAQVDVKGKLAELFLSRELMRLKQAGVFQSVQWLDEDGRFDFLIEINGRVISVECKNVRSLQKGRKPSRGIEVELQKTRNSKDGSNTRSYKADQFDILSVALFNRTRTWNFLHIAVKNLEKLPGDLSRLQIMQNVPAKPEGPWKSTIEEAIADL